MDTISILMTTFGIGTLMIFTAIIALGFYRLGQEHGILAERERREGLEARVRQQIETAARNDRELWETEIDA